LKYRTNPLAAICIQAFPGALKLLKLVYRGAPYRYLVLRQRGIQGIQHIFFVCLVAVKYEAEFRKARVIFSGDY